MARRAASGAAPEVASREALGTEQPFADLRVMVAEDHPMTARAVQRALELRAATVTVAGTFGDAVEAVETGSYDASIVDVFLPGGSGLTVVERLRARERRPARDRRTAVVVMSGEAGFEVAARAQALDAALLAKPVGAAQLDAAMSLALRLREPLPVELASPSSPAPRSPAEAIPPAKEPPGSTAYVLSFDFDAATVSTDSGTVRLTPGMRDLVQLFLDAREAAWLGPESVARACAIAANESVADTVYKRVSRLRGRFRSIGAEGWLERANGVGYRRSPLWETKVKG